MNSDLHEHIGTLGRFSNPTLCGSRSCNQTIIINGEGREQTQPCNVIGEETTARSNALPGTGNRAFVLNHDKTPLMPCTRQRAFELLRKNRAAIFRHVPFTIILRTQLEHPVLQPVELRIDPGSKTTGLALVITGRNGQRVLMGLHLQHRSAAIRLALLHRAQMRRRRRSQNLRHRQPRFDNRTRPNGWLSPSLQSRVDHLRSWNQRLRALAPLTTIAVERVAFDTQKLQNPTISGVAYQQGTLLGYEIREYLLEHWNRTCAYCDARNVPFQIEHILAKVRGGSDRLANLTIACEPCNHAKTNTLVEVFLAHDPQRLARILAHSKAPLRDAAAINATRYAIANALKPFGLPVSCWSGGRTKFNRTTQGYPKEHWIDAACVGERGIHVRLKPNMAILHLRATGRGTRHVRRTDRYGFPRGTAKTASRRHGFSTGDLVRATISKGKAPGTHIGRILATNRTRFDLRTDHGSIGTTHRTLTLLQRHFGYAVV